MALTKIVNGKSVKLTAQEETELRAEWAQADIEAAKPKPPTLAERVATLETALAALSARAPK